ncbi:hypothetical protein [Alkalihalobacillus deserti]|uniref:hypothetical protein n=1 Tax=Alkalihalobacillus deserti TaxID=2879466 RepID=UPI001D1556DE|nr:hypothetical protein [Alkalihalobacillus deserti]
MGALSLLVLFSATVVPLLTIVYSERVTIREEVRALTILEDSVLEFVVDGVPGLKSINQYEISSDIVKDGIVNTCCTWVGSNGREYEHCLLAAN